jgi:hypothetical protein
MTWFQIDDKELSYSIRQAPAAIEAFTAGFIQIRAITSTLPITAS